MIFGKRQAAPVTASNSPPINTSGGGTGQGGGSTSGPAFPWSGDPAVVACNLATGNLANNLQGWLVQNGRVHAETYVAAAGAIAGFTAQCSLLAAANGFPVQLQVATTKSGKRFFFGEALNGMLLTRAWTQLNAAKFARRRAGRKRRTSRRACHSGWRRA
jgi:hypothetical protein